MFNYNPDTDGKEAKDLLDITYKHIKFDKKLYKQLLAFRMSWVNKSVEYSEFLGGNSLGVQNIRFSSRDDKLLMLDIYQTDPGLLLTNIYRLPDIEKNWAVSTNPVLQTMCYTMHRFIKDGHMGNKLEDALHQCYNIFAYKVFGSLLSHYFKHPTSQATAKAIYEKLSNRFLIKKLGTWNNVLDYRANSIIPSKGLHTDRLKTYTTNDSVRIINDLQGGIREHIKAIYLVMLDVHSNDSKIKSTSMVSKSEGSEDSTKELLDRPDKYIGRLKSVISTRVDLIDDDLIYLVSQFVKASDAKIIRHALEILSEEYDPRKTDAVYIDQIILKTITYCNLKGIRSDYRGNIVEIINLMKGYWSSGSVTDGDVKLVKSSVIKLVKKSTSRKTKWVIATNMLSVIIYLFVRSVK